MFESNDLHEMYQQAATSRDHLKKSISREFARDLAILFVALFNENPKFIELKEPYRTDRKQDILNFLGIDQDKLPVNPNLEPIKLRLSVHYSTFYKIAEIFAFCCLSSGDATSLFQQYIFRDEYENIVKYSKK